MKKAYEIIFIQTFCIYQKLVSMNWLKPIMHNLSLCFPVVILPKFVITDIYYILEWHIFIGHKNQQSVPVNQPMLYIDCN